MLLRTMKMINVVYLVLVFTGGSGMMTSQSIPQANMKQCEINKRYYDDVSHRGSEVGHFTRAHCIVGVK